MSRTGHSDVAGDTEAPQVQAPPLRFSTLPELKSHYIKQAYEAHADRLAQNVPVTASSQKIGTTFGVGVGLYFEVIGWFKWVFLLLSIFAVPYLVTINTSVFTDAVHKDDHGFGIKVYEDFKIYSFTFAPIVDDSMDNGTLQYMNTNILNEWEGPMRKSTFLIWIACVDAFGILLFLAFIMFLGMRQKRFLKAIDKNTVEAADYTVLVHGLPADADAREIGVYFSRFGDVMDVVLIKQMGEVLKACARASQLEQQRLVLQDELSIEDSGASQELSQKVTKKLEDLMGSIEVKMNESDFPLRAAFVSFNTFQEQQACINNCPKGWVSRLWQPKADRFRGTQRFWTEPACSPDDYIHENVSCSRTSRILRVIFTRLVVLGILLLCAACITKLSNLSTDESRVITWKHIDINDALAPDPTMVPKPPAGPNGSSSDQATSTLSPLGSDGTDYSSCDLILSTTCSSVYSQMYDAHVNLSFGHQVQWSSMMNRLLYQRPMLRAMEDCAGNSNETCAAVSSCYPCLCYGLSVTSGDQKDDPSWLMNTKSSCGVYIDDYSIKSWGIRIGVALVIAALNQALKLVLEWLLLFERHWTLSSQEMAYAWIAFLAQLLNSVVVLVLVNATDLTEDSITGRATVFVGRDNNRPKWVSSFILDGSYDDFTRAWFENVGLPIMILLMINILQPVGALFADVAWKWSQRCFVLRCSKHAGQGQYNMAFAPPSFDLQNRVADAMLNLTIAFIFASGMPLCYIIAMVSFLVKDVVERITLTRVCRTSSRYRPNLAGLIVALLPWAALGHCLFGLWMHTYFKIEYDDVVSAALSGSSVFSATWNHINDTSIIVRITQANGLPLLLAAILIFLWILITYLIWPLSKPLIIRCFRVLSCMPCGHGKESEHLAPETHQDSVTTAPSPSYEEAVSNHPRQIIGVPTYRLHHHPRYTHVFMGQLYNIMSRAVEGPRFTRLKSTSDGSIHVAPCIHLAADMEGLEEMLLCMPSTKLSGIMRRMATRSSSAATRTGATAAGHRIRHFSSAVPGQALTLEVTATASTGSGTERRAGVGVEAGSEGVLASDHSGGDRGTAMYEDIEASSDSAGGSANIAVSSSGRRDRRVQGAGPESDALALLDVWTALEANGGGGLGAARDGLQSEAEYSGSQQQQAGGRPSALPTGNHAYTIEGSEPTAPPAPAGTAWGVTGTIMGTAPPDNTMLSGD